MNNLALSVALATAPSSAFAELRERPRFWFPLLLLVTCTAAIVWWYYSIVDIEWLKATVLIHDPSVQRLPEGDRAAAMNMMTGKTLLWTSVISVVVALPIVYLIWALYLLVAARATRMTQGFKHWFSFTCWTSLPLLLSTAVSVILLLLSDTAQVAPSILQPLSINELVLHRPIGSPGHTMFEAMGIPLVLSVILMIIGVRSWSQRSWAFSAGIILVPTIAFYGIWAFFTFR